MEIGVATYLKKINRSLIISKIIEHGKISKADLSNITKLTKATISTQVANLSEVSFLKQLSEKLDNPNLTYKDIQNLIIERDPVVMTQMEGFIKYISIGLNNIINILNPDTVVLNSKLLQLVPDVESKIKTNLKSSISDFKELLISELGTNACVLGACTLAIKNFFEIPDLSLTMKQNV